jgi:hypothetical protein
LAPFHIPSALGRLRHAAALSHTVNNPASVSIGIVVGSCKERGEKGEESRVLKEETRETVEGEFC